MLQRTNECSGVCRPKVEGAEAPKEQAVKVEKTGEADGNERGLDELMLLAHSRHLSEEPEAPGGRSGAQAAQPAPAEPAQPAKDDDVRSHSWTSAIACHLYRGAVTP